MLPQGVQRGLDKRPGVLKLPLAALVCHPELQMRDSISPETVDEYAEKMRAGEQFPPLKVAILGDTNYVWDGFQRFQAAMAADLGDFACEVTQVETWQQLLMLALSANAKHGLRRSNDDKRKCVKRAIEILGPAASNREIARACAVSDKLVADILQEMKTPVLTPDQIEPGLPVNRGPVRQMKVKKPKTITAKPASGVIRLMLTDPEGALVMDTECNKIVEQKPGFYHFQLSLPIEDVKEPVETNELPFEVPDVA